MKVLKFGAVWCPGCLVMRPRWKEIEKANIWLETEYFDYDQDKKAVEEWSIDDTLPTFVFIDSKNREILRLSGEVSRQKLEQLITEHRGK